MAAHRFCIRYLTLPAALLCCGMTSAASAAEPENDVFVSGSEGYQTFRIPALLATPRGTLLAFCEGRKNGRGDSGNIDLVYKRSEDGGKTWSSLSVLWDDDANTCGNPCPVVDTETGRIWLPMTWNHGDDSESEIKQRTGHDTRRVFLSYSDDDGKTWVEPYEITSQAKRPEWTWYATGPGIGIQLQRGTHHGRLVIPCDHNLRVGKQSVRRSHCLYSDDHGKTWKLSESLGDKTNECTVAELSDGRLWLNMRSYHRKNRRAIAYSSDGGATWSDVKLDDALIEPVCQASALSLGAAAPRVILFANPASTKRENMVVRLSRDDAATWPEERRVYNGSAAYSSLADLGSGRIGLLYERDNYQKIRFVGFHIQEFLPVKKSE